MTDLPDGERLLGTSAAAELLNVSKATIIRRVHSGAIPIVGQVGTRGEFIIRASVIEAIAADAVSGGD